MQQNLLPQMKLPPRKPNEVVAGDITYLPLQDGSFCYLATWTDLFWRLVAGWEVQGTMTEGLIISALEKAVRRRSGFVGGRSGFGSWRAIRFDKVSSIVKAQQLQAIDEPSRRCL